MNIANYLQGNRYPLSTQGLDFIQNQVLTVQRLCAVLGVGKWIIDGCEESTSGGVTTIAAGTVVINKEIVNVDQQTKNATCYIREVQNTTPNRLERKLIFGASVDASQNMNWSSFSRVDISALATKAEVEALRNLVLPKGAIIMWSGTTNMSNVEFPTGFHLCNGDTVEGYGLVPDLRSRFIVGYDERTDNQTIDYSEIGTTGGEAKHVLTIEEMPSHKHDFQDSYFSENVGVNNGFIGSNNTDMDNQLIQRPSVTATKGGDEAHENRPPFYVLAFLIKVI